MIFVFLACHLQLLSQVPERNNSLSVNIQPCLKWKLLNKKAS